MRDPFDLQRFVDAQATVIKQVTVIEQVYEELRQGRKATHWMWFVFPQMKGLGHSPEATRYGIGSQSEAEAYLLHPLLGPRLRECTRLVNQIEGCSIDEIFGYPDNMKFRSCMTLFASATPDNQVFTEALRKYFNAA
jgi:uncharacterized protein (DUF1810 family)